jgi:KamA family protein
VAPGTQHKYPHTALLLVTETCATHCRFCFRKRLFHATNKEAAPDIRLGLAYIAEHPAINNVLLTGGDPLTLSTRRLEAIIRQLREMDHVKVIRIGTKTPAVNPFRILNDSDLPKMLGRYSDIDRRIYLMTHFNCPQELTEPALEAVDTLRRSGVILANQTPILRGINHEPARLAELMTRLAEAGVPPYYFFQCRPTRGNWPFALSLTEVYRVFERAKTMVSGLAKRARLVMSHASGKIEIVGMTQQHIYLRYHRARLASDEGRFMVFHRDERAMWLDDLTPVEQAHAPRASKDRLDAYPSFAD